jgi:ABC-type phosphate transport system substrate-binding protein
MRSDLPRRVGTIRRRRASVLARALIATLVANFAFGMSVLDTNPASAATQVPVSGAGSTWSSNAMEQWIGDVNQYGIKIQFAATGSSDGRTQFRNGTVDFAVSEIPYGQVDNGSPDPAPTNRSFSYMPIVAGGTSFMYHLHINGQQVTNLRLSGLTLAKIFTGVITNWSDPVIGGDNPGIILPARQIVAPRPTACCHAARRRTSRSCPAAASSLSSSRPAWRAT